MRKQFLKSIADVEVRGKAVLVLGSLDVEDGENPRVESVRGVVRWLEEAGAGGIKVFGHRETEYDICAQLRGEFPGVEFDDGVRKDGREKINDEEYARILARGWEVYVNEDFATSHRPYASIVGVPEAMKKAGKEVGVGKRFEKELEKLDEVWVRVKGSRKRVLVIGGKKVEDKQRFAEKMGGKFTKVLRGGLLPGVELREDGLDITEAAAAEYVREIAEAEVILAAGVMGKYEDPEAEGGTRAVLEAISRNTGAYKVAGGGDIEHAISRYGLTEKFDWISVGGGAMLEYLATGTLVGIEAML